MKPGVNEFYIDVDEIHSSLFFACLRGLAGITLQRLHGIPQERGDDHP